MLSALGLTQQEIKPKALAIIFTICQGRHPVAQAAGAPKKFANLGSCLSDGNTVKLINDELQKQGFPQISVKHPEVLGAPTATQ